MFRALFGALAVAAIAALPIAAPAQDADALLPSQSVITGTLETSIDSKTAQVGDPFVLDVQPPYPGDDPRFSGAKVFGHVDAVTKASLARKGVVHLSTDRITLADGTTALLRTQVLSVDPQGNRANSTVKTIAGAVVGDIVGNIFGKAIGTNIGGALGAVGGALYAANTGQNVALGQGSQVSLKTVRPATILSRRQAISPNAPPRDPNAPSYSNGAPPQPQNPGPYPTPYH